MKTDEEWRRLLTPEQPPRPSARKILFVCMGNICRSPLAEAIFSDEAHKTGIEGAFVLDSAGTGPWHAGEPADPRTYDVASRHGVPLVHTARQVGATDFADFDLILAMDRHNLAELEARCPARYRPKLQLMRDYDEPGRRSPDVPDPYYGGPEGFDRVFAILTACCRNLLASLTGGARQQSSPTRD